MAYEQDFGKALQVGRPPNVTALFPTRCRSRRLGPSTSAA